MVKRLVLAGIILLLSSLLLAGCQNENASFSNEDGHFVLSPGGTYTQTFGPTDSQVLPTGTLVLPSVDHSQPGDRYRRGDKDRYNDKEKAARDQPARTESGIWRLISPSDGFGHEGYTVELSDVHRCHGAFGAGTYTLVVPVSRIRGFDKLAAKQKT